MRRVIITDKYKARGLRVEPYDNGWCGRFACLNMKMDYINRFLMNEMSFELWDIFKSNGHRFTNINREFIPKDVEMFVFSGVLYRMNFDEWKSFLNMYPKAKVVVFPQIDFRHWGRIPKWFVERVDLFLDWQKHNYKQRSWFETILPEYAYKHIFFPHCVTPYDNWMSVEYNEMPLQQALFSGRVGDRYEIRNSFLRAVLDDEELEGMVDVCYDARAIRIADFAKDCSKHYWKLEFMNRDMVIKDEYIEMLSRYLCGVTCSTNRNHLLGKMFEIPASGSILVCDRFNDLDSAGFIPDVHYVEITQKNVAETVKDICGHPEEYEHIRRAGYDFVRENHNIKVRCEQLKGYVEGVLNEY